MLNRVKGAWHVAQAIAVAGLTEIARRFPVHETSRMSGR